MTMIDQVIEKSEPEITTPFVRLTAQEVEQITQPLYEHSLAEMKAYWKKRFDEINEARRK